MNRENSISLNNEQQNKLANLRWVLGLAIFALLLYSTPFVISRILKTPYPFAAITSNSMWPTIKEGDLVLIEGVTDAKNLKAGDIIVFSQDEDFIIHRIVNINGAQITTKGDANFSEDDPILFSNVVGKTVNAGEKPIKIPYLGKLTEFMRDGS